MEVDLGDILCGLGNSMHIERTKAQVKLRRYLEDHKSDQNAQGIFSTVTSGITDLLNSSAMEQRLGGLLASQIVLNYWNKEEFVDVLIKKCGECLEDAEVRVRLAVGETLGALAVQSGTNLYCCLKDRLLESIKQNFDRDEENGEDEGNDDTMDVLDSLLESSYTVTKPGTGDLRHGTEGWKCLETSFKALLHIMEACGRDFVPYITPELRELIFKGLTHLNRFVRETSFMALGSMCETLGMEGLVELGEEVVRKLAKGLGDDWSQVRYAASKSTRKFMSVLADSKAQFYPYILPQMCLNRYYVAEGVKFYSQETWRLVVGEEGRSLVAQFAPFFVDYYVMQCGANNHAVREAACACIAELMVKVEKDSVREHVSRLLGALVNCFKDASWPVRDAACCACGRCVLAFPDESQPILDELYELWFAHLWDNIPTVRENSAVALGNAIRAYQDAAVSRIVPVLRSMILKAKDQPQESTRFSELENVTQFGVAAVRGVHANNEQKHTDQQMFSCGSLAPKLKRGGGCMDHGFTREKQPWEASDGSVYLIRELSAVSPETVSEFMPNLAELARIGGFMHANHLHETVWKVLPAIARNLGKRPFKVHIEEFLGPLFVSVKCGHQLEESAAGMAVASIRDFLGPGIFRGRLSEEQARIMDTCPSIPMSMGGGRFG